LSKVLKQEIIDTLKFTGPTTKNTLNIMLNAHHRKKEKISQTIDMLIKEGKMIYLGIVGEISFDVGKKLKKDSPVYGLAQHNVKIKKYVGEKTPAPYRPAFEPLDATSRTYRQQSYRDR
jgi:hypothetical protein